MTVLRRTAGHVFKQVTPRLWRLTFFLPGTVNVWLLEDDGGITVVDTGQPWNANAISSAIDLIGKKLQRIVITHAHPDHAGSAAELARRSGAKIFAHREEVPFITGQACMADLPGSAACKRLLTIGKRLRLLNPPPAKAVEVVHEGEKIGSLKVLHTPGHTPGSISLWDDTDGLLFCGDNASNTLGILRLNLSYFTLDCGLLCKSFERYRETGARLLLPGHGPEYVSTNVAEDLLAKSPLNFSAHG